jgi:hypothetical protein
MSEQTSGDDIEIRPADDASARPVIAALVRDYAGHPEPEVRAALAGALRDAGLTLGEQDFETAVQEIVDGSVEVESLADDGTGAAL